MSYDKFRLPNEMTRLKNVHLEELRPLLQQGAGDKLVIPNDLRFVFICYTNRCGSNYVAELLASGGKYNLGGEFFNFDTVKHHSRRLGLGNMSQYVSFLCRHAGRSGLLISKVSATHIVLLSVAGILDFLRERILFILVERSDRLGQSISMSIASQTGQWTSYMKAQTPPDRLSFDRSQIDQILHNIVAQQAAFHAFFAVNGIDYFALNYEQLASRPQFCLRTLCEWLKIDGTEILKKREVRTGKQASKVNAEWKRLYLSQEGLPAVAA